jgi:DivIVA domain-containing protein
VNESDRRQHVISTAPHLTPDEIANRAFGRKGRGYAEPEVRSFLKRVAEELTIARERERELGATIDSLEEQLRAPRPLTEPELLEALGDETARLLRSAREAGDDIRRKADERAARITEDAIIESERVRAEAVEMYSQRAAEADARAADLVAAAEADAIATRERALAEGDALVEAARLQGRDMVLEAKAARERVLSDLVRRRALLQAQIEELRVGRERLLESYGVVKRTFLEATEALVQVEARAAAERSASINEPLDIAAEIAREIAALESTDGDGEIDIVVDVVEVELGGEAGGDADVDSLFARLRAESDDPEAATVAVAAVEPASPKIDPPAADEWRARRAEALDPLLHALVKQAKRRAQDDQNALLDAVRRHKGRPRSEQVLPDGDELVRGWASGLQESIRAAYGAGRVAVGAAEVEVPPELVQEAAESIVAPLRERITIAIDSGDEGDTGGLVERIGARYREWKNQTLEEALQDALSSAWSRGVYDGVPDGSVLWWVPVDPGRCSDCDDNGLEPTVKGKPFPTGQAFPPAHPGCQCLLAPAEVLSSPTAPA